MKCLAAFDFDHTIIDKNTDSEVATLIQGGISLQLKELHKKDGWTAFMQGVFNTLNCNGVTVDTITDIIISLKPTEGMVDLIKELASNLNFDVIIISDSNSYFIDSWLTKYHLQKYVMKVFTNPAEISDGCLRIQMYHFQDYCELSSKNLCKGQILMDFIEDQKKNNIVYERVIYCGDGANDLCPILKLGPNDCGFVRDNYKCAELIKKVENGEIKNKHGLQQVLKAVVHVWATGYDILNHVNTLE